MDSLYRRIVGLLDAGVLKTAFELIQTLLSGSQLYVFQNKLDELQETYRYMLDYYMQGSEDPTRQQIYINICTGAYELTDQIRHHALKGSPLAYYDHARMASDNSIGMDTLLTKLRGEAEIGDKYSYEKSDRLLFAKLWTTPFLTENEMSAVGRALKNKDIPLMTKCQAVSALLLGLQASFDENKLYLLFDAAGLDEDEVKIRAYIAIFLALNIYVKRTSHYPGILRRLENLSETPEFKRILQTICLCFILSRETEKVSIKLRDEIFPEMMKAASFSETNFDMNPEWTDMLTNNSLAKKIEEFHNLQEEGVDVLHSSFIELKNYPFFHNVYNWFLPFIPQLALIVQSPVEGAVIDLLTASPFMCNSDKYSLFLSLMQIPESRRKTMTSQLETHLHNANTQYGEALKSKQDKVKNIVNQYIQDLFRFCKLFPKRKEFTDVFIHSPELHNIPVLKPYFSEPEMLITIADLYLRKNYVENAQYIYEQLVTLVPENEMIYQKLGYCRQMNGDIQGALAEYLHSEILNPNSKWLMRRIGNCYKALKQPEKALAFYLRYEKMMPDNAQALILIGHCYMDMKNYTDALNYYFKADYIEKENIRAWRAIAWCSFLNKKYEQAYRYYNKILADKPQTQDYINAGHAAWALKQRFVALTHYIEAIRQETSSLDDFFALFNQDIPDLIQAGIDASEMPLLLDQLRYKA